MCFSHDSTVEKGLQEQRPTILKERMVDPAKSNIIQRRGNLLPLLAELCSAWGMVDSIYSFLPPVIAKPVRRLVVAIRTPLCQTSFGVGDGGFDLHFLLLIQKKIFVATSI